MLDALEQALWARRPSGTVHHSDKGSQYVSLAYTQRLKEAGLLASTGSTGDSYDNAMAESINGLYKAEVIHRKSWKNRAEVELATLTWVDWYNNCLLYTSYRIGDNRIMTLLNTLYDLYCPQAGTGKGSNNNE